MLNQQHPEKFARTLTYYDYLSQARLEQLRNFNETLRQLANVGKDIDLQQAQLLVQKSNLDSQSEELAKVRQERQQALAKLNQDYKARDQKLQARQQDQADLAKVLKTIEETLARQRVKPKRPARKRWLPLARPKRNVSAKLRPSLVTTAPAAVRALMNPHRIARSKPPAQSFPGPACPTADLLQRPEENFHGQSMVDCLHVLVKHAVMTSGPSGTAS